MGVKELDGLDKGFLTGIKSGGPIPPAQGLALLGGQQWNYSHLAGRNSHTQTHTHAHAQAFAQDMKTIPLHLLSVKMNAPLRTRPPTHGARTRRGRDGRVAGKGRRGAKTGSERCAFPRAPNATSATLVPSHIKRCQEAPAGKLRLPTARPHLIAHLHCLQIQRLGGGGAGRRADAEVRRPVVGWKSRLRPPTSGIC